MTTDEIKIRKPELGIIEEQGISVVRAFDPANDGIQVPFAGGGDIVIPPPTNGHSFEIRKGKFVPIWKLGASSKDPNIGNGALMARYFAIGSEIEGWDVTLDVDLSSGSQTHPGTGTGSYEIIIPEDFAWLRPNEPIIDWSSGSAVLVSHNNVRGGGACPMWILGDHYDATCKWTFREFRKKDNLAPESKIIMQVKEDEFQQRFPKVLGVGSAFNFAFTLHWGVDK